MAKKRRPVTKNDSEQAAPASKQLGDRIDSIGQFGLAFTLLACLLYPCDSVSVERGSAIYLPLLAIPLATAALWRWPLGPANTRMIDCLLAGQCLWVGVATWFTVGRGNVRFALNEFWVWISFAAVFIATRRLVRTPEDVKKLVALLVCSTIALAVYCVHQSFISIPATIRQYELNPDAVLQSLRIDAPEGSAIRYQFESRMRAGEATATFNLSNSAASFCLFGYAILLGIVIEQRKRAASWQSQAVLFVAAILCAASLLATGSRTSTGLLALVSLFSLMRAVFAKSKLPDRIGPRLTASIAIAVPCVLIAAGMIALQSDSQMNQVPRSIAFRFLYWQSSLSVLGDSMLTGAGPGNFKSAYLQYRSPTLSESISDPHNFLMESLVSGGLPLGILTLAILWRIVYAWRTTVDSASCTEDGEKEPRDKTFMLGWLGSFVLLIIAGFVYGVAPDIEPIILSCPIICAALYAMWSWLGHNSVRLETLWVACVALLASLSFSGGWTVPGLAMPAWMALALSIPTESGQVSLTQPVRRRWLATTAGIGLFAMFTLGTFRPVMQCFGALMLSQDAANRGAIAKATRRLRDAADLDPWDPEPLRMKSRFLFYQCLGEDSDVLRQPLSQALQELSRRDPANPFLHQQIGDTHLQLYRRFGSQCHLQECIGHYLYAIQRDPTSIVLRAQAALVLESLGRQEEATVHWKAMEELDSANSNDESDFNMLSVLVPRKGMSDSEATRRSKMSDVLTNREKGNSVN